MIQVVLVRTKSGKLKSCCAEGHANFACKGQDIVCAAVSILLRTSLDVLSGQNGIKLKTDSAIRGILSFWAEEENKSGADSAEIKQGFSFASVLLTCTGDFLQKGLLSLQNEYPSHVSLQVKIVND